MEERGQRPSLPAGGVSPTICVGAHSGVSPKILLTMENKNKSLLNRYVRFIYRKMMREHGVQETREQALRIFAISTPERERVRRLGAATLSDDFKEKLMALVNEWGIRPNFIAESISAFGTPEDMEQILLDLTPIRVRIRKLTPTECLRLMDVHDEDIDRMKGSGLSNSALYKLAGNSIVCACLEGIFTQLFRADTDSLF